MQEGGTYRYVQPPAGVLSDARSRRLRIDRGVSRRVRPRPSLQGLVRGKRTAEHARLGACDERATKRPIPITGSTATVNVQLSNRFRMPAVVPEHAPHPTIPHRVVRDHGRRRPRVRHHPPERDELRLEVPRPEVPPRDVVSGCRSGARDHPWFQTVYRNPHLHRSARTAGRHSPTASRAVDPPGISRATGVVKTRPQAGSSWEIRLCGPLGVDML